jgi:hypothetical protein
LPAAHETFHIQQRRLVKRLVASTHGLCPVDEFRQQVLPSEVKDVGWISFASCSDYAIKFKQAASRPWPGLRIRVKQRKSQRKITGVGQAGLSNR